MKGKVDLSAFLKVKSLLAIDISDTGIKLLEISFSSSPPVITNYIPIIFPHSLRKLKNKDEKKAKIIDLLSAELKKHKINANEVLYLISSGSIFSRKIRMPKMNSKEIDEGIRWEASNQIPFSLDNSYFDWHFVKEVELKDKTVNDEYVIAASSKKIVDDILEIILAIDKHPYCIGIPICAVRNLISILPQFDVEGVVAAIDVGAKRTNIVISEGREVVFYREIPIGEDNISEILENEFKDGNIKIDEIKKICSENKIYTYCLKDEHTINDPMLRRIVRGMRPLVERILNEIKRSFDYYREQSGKSKVDKIVLSGKTAVEEGVGIILEKVFAVSVEPIDLAKAVSLAANVDKDLVERDMLDLALLIGLALGHSDQINFVPQEYRDKKVKILQIAIVTVIMIVAFAVVLFMSVALKMESSKLKKEIAASNATMSNILPKVQEFNRKCELYRSNKAKVDKLLDKQLLIEKALKDFSVFVPRSMVFNRLELIDNGWLKISGYVFDDAVNDLSSEAVITDFIIEIENSSYFLDVKLEESYRGSEFKVPYSVFSIMCKVASRKDLGKV